MNSRISQHADQFQIATEFRIIKTKQSESNRRLLVVGQIFKLESKKRREKKDSSISIPNFGLGRLDSSLYLFSSRIKWFKRLGFVQVREKPDSAHHYQ
jgi:hypothetical protein